MNDKLKNELKIKNMNYKIKDECIDRYGWCIYYAIINNKISDHEFIYSGHNINNDDAELILECEDCDFEYIVRIAYSDKDIIFSSIMELGIKNFCDNKFADYRLLQSDINDLLYSDCEYEYKQYLKNKKIITNNK